MGEVRPRGVVRSKELVRILPGVARNLPLEPGSSDRIPGCSPDYRSSLVADMHTEPVGRIHHPAGSLKSVL